MVNVHSICNDIVQPVLALPFMAGSMRSLYVPLIDDCFADDANFHHWHHKSMGDIDFNYFPEYIIPKMQVDAVGDYIVQLRPRAHPRHASSIAKEAIDECERSYEADGNKAKANGQVLYMMIQGSACWYATTIYHCMLQMLTPQESSKSMPSPSLNTCLDFFCLP